MYYKTRPYVDSDVPDEPQCIPQRLRIIHVGGGASGILFAHKVQKLLDNYELVCYEKNDSIGGAWHENKYPGCACDVPAHTYVYPFEPNPNWTGYYSYAPEIKQYLVDFAEKHDCLKYIQLNTTVLRAVWNSGEHVWNVELFRDGKTFHDKANVLVNGSGCLNNWKWPDIEGLHDFNGKLVHSANWDTSSDWKGKRVGVIGSGSSSIQMVPQFAKTAEKVSVFIRNRTWIGPQMGVGVSNKEADPEAQEPLAAGKHTYTEREKERFRNDPEYFLKYRSLVERKMTAGFDVYFRGSKENIETKKFMLDYMSEKLGNREDLKAMLIPEWSPGCRRFTPGEGYLEALASDNVDPVFGEIVKVVPEGLVTADGRTHEFDILACATGFNVAYLPHFTIVGQQGHVMQSQKDPNIYAAIAIPKFPNYWVVDGPRGNWGQGCVLPAHESHIEYILQCCKKLQEDRISYMVPRQDVTDQFNDYLDHWHKKNSVWAENCRSWYKDQKPDGRVFLWSGSLHHHLKFMRRPRYEHYNISYQDDENIWAFMGNGMTITEVKYKDNPEEMPVPYIRNNEDEAWDIE